MNNITEKIELNIINNKNNNYINNNNMNINDLTILTKFELLTKCKELNILQSSLKKKNELINCILNYFENNKVIYEQNILLKQDNLIKEKKDNNLKFIDLFCGIGGFHQALTKLNYKCVFACDIDEKCRTIYEQNYNIKPAGDITQIEIVKIPSFDILCGGFPC